MTLSQTDPRYMRHLADADLLQQSAWLHAQLAATEAQADACRRSLKEVEAEIARRATSSEVVAGNLRLQPLAEWCERMGVDPSTGRRWCRAGRVDGAIRSGNGWLVPVRAIPPAADAPPAPRSAGAPVADAAEPGPASPSDDDFDADLGDLSPESVLARHRAGA